MSTIRTMSNGTTITLESHPPVEGLIVFLGHPDAPEDMRSVEAGRILKGGFQPAIFAAFTMRPEVLRAIADLIEVAPDA